MCITSSVRASITNPVCEAETDCNQHALKTDKKTALLGRRSFSNVYGNDREELTASNSSHEAPNDEHHGVDGCGL